MVYKNQSGCCLKKELLGRDQLGIAEEHRSKRQGLESGVVARWDLG